MAPIVVRCIGHWQHYGATKLPLAARFQREFKLVLLHGSLLLLDARSSEQEAYKCGEFLVYETRTLSRIVLVESPSRADP